MKKLFLKNNFKTISKTRRRFLSILVMAFLGIGFFAGLVAASPDMRDSLDKYVDNSNLFDVKVISTLGVTDEDVDEIKKIDGIETVYGMQTKDSLVKFDDKESICKVIEYCENMNVPNLIIGKLPENSNECLLDSGYSISEDLESYIGKTIVLENDDEDSDGNSIFTVKELKIVGIVESPIYISSERGNTSIGSGNISFYIYTKDDVINMDYYTEIYATIKGTKELVTNSDEYLSLVDPVIQKIEDIKSEREIARYDSLVNEANRKIDEAQKEYDDKKAEVENELNNAEKQINDAKAQINSSEKELENSEKEIATQETNLEKQFKEADNQIQEAEAQISIKEAELEKVKEELEANKKEINSAIDKIDTGISEAKTYLNALQEQKDTLVDTSRIDAKIQETQATIHDFESQKSELENKLKLAQEQITSDQTQIKNAKNEIKEKKATLATNKNAVYKKIENAKKEITKGKSDLESAKIEINKKQQEFEDGKKEAETKLNEAQTKINNAKDEIRKIEKSKWYIQDRLDNSGYVNIFDAIKTMSNIAKMFPVIFYLVAVLISLSSMTRMIEEERVEIGTLKSLGYTNMQIISKYVSYAFFACIIGGFIGMTVGFYLLPNIVWSLYSMLYTIPEFYATYRLGVGLLGILSSFICIGGATIIVAYNELKEMPSVLMRPKSPKMGKKIILERIKFVWKRMNFSKKVTARNIFRYKKRAIMTIVGIAGCTGLMLTGFGLRDSVIDIPSSQFGGIFKYESSVSLSDTEGINELKEYLDSNENVENYKEICATTGKLVNEKSSYDITTFIPNGNEGFDQVCKLTDISNGKEIQLSDKGILITDKVAEFLNINPGDEVTLFDSYDIEHKVKVDAIVENYVEHYAYMSRNFYEENIKTYETNMALINTKDISDEEQNKISEELLNINGVASVQVSSKLVESVSDMLNTMNYVVIILIVASALLAFVVLYNLANINIGERQREIATLKVLGFYDKEVDNYINKETIIFTCIGVIVGLVFGIFLTNAIIASVEIDKLRFINQVNFNSYIYSALITIIFSLIVNFIIHFTLKKIDMIESLKSVE